MSDTDILDLEASILMLEQGKETTLVGLINDDGQTSILIFHSLSATLTLSTLKTPFFPPDRNARNQGNYLYMI